jgi:thioredoxin 1
MISRRLFAVLVSSTMAGFLALPAQADDPKFTRAGLEAAQKAGGPILVDVFAPWCPTCKAQRVILKDLREQDKFKSLVALEVDFDSQKDDLRFLKADKQSTLIVYKGDKEVGRLVGETRMDAIEALLAKAY